MRGTVTMSVGAIAKMTQSHDSRKQSYDLPRYSLHFTDVYGSLASDVPKLVLCTSLEDTVSRHDGFVVHVFHTTADRLCRLQHSRR